MSAFLGDFEQMVLLAVLQAGDEAYGVTIRRELEERAGRETSRGALYVTLDRLERKGYLDSRMGPGDDDRGGRRRRYYRVSGEGLAALGRTRRALLDLWKDVEWKLDEA